MKQQTLSEEEWEYSDILRIFEYIKIVRDSDNAISNTFELIRRLRLRDAIGDSWRGGNSDNDI